MAVFISFFLFSQVIKKVITLVHSSGQKYKRGISGTTCVCVYIYVFVFVFVRMLKRESECVCVCVLGLEGVGEYYFHLIIFFCQRNFFGLPSL